MEMENKTKEHLKTLISGGVLLFTVLIYLPCDTYLNNLTEFNFPITGFVFSLLIKFVLLLIPVALLGIFPSEKAQSIISSLFLGLTLCLFTQYMFMNRNLGLVIGEEVNWSEYTSYGLITLGIWIIILALPFIWKRALDEKWDKIGTGISAFIGGIQLLSIIILTITMSDSAFGYRNDFVDGTEQYTVSSKKNIVTFVFDAADNLYINKILSENPEAFDGLEDFTLYTNTCSVHDYTLASMTQMLTGTLTCPMYDTDSWLETAWESQKADNFYKRLHNAGYTINAYMQADIPLNFLKNKYDNAESGSKPVSVDKNRIQDSLLKMSLYRSVPFVFKKYIDINSIRFKGFVTFPSESFYFSDEEYAENLNLKKSDDDKNYFIIEHLNGPHPPCDDVIAETENCLKIVKEYINQLKEMGIYDDSTIIITSDHGRHTGNFTEAAATPIFMIKEANKTYDKMQITNAPVYHADFLATYLKSADLYTEADKEEYGKTVFDFDDNSVRDRIWYDHTEDTSFPNPNGAACNVYYAYKYTGNSSDLKKVIDDKKPYDIIVKQ